MMPYSNDNISGCIVFQNHGKNAKHAAITDSSTIGTVSNLCVQLFEHMYGPKFRVIPEATSLFLTKQYGLQRPMNGLPHIDVLGPVHPTPMHKL
jgi:hypothetical protein